MRIVRSTHDDVLVFLASVGTQVAITKNGALYVDNRNDAVVFPYIVPSGYIIVISDVSLFSISGTRRKEVRSVGPLVRLLVRTV